MLPRLGVRIRQCIPCKGAQVPNAPIRPREGGLQRRALCSSTESSRQSSQKAYISTYIGLIPVYGMDSETLTGHSRVHAPSWEGDFD